MSAVLVLLTKNHVRPRSVIKSSYPCMQMTKIAIDSALYTYFRWKKTAGELQLTHACH